MIVFYILQNKEKLKDLIIKVIIIIYIFKAFLFISTTISLFIFFTLKKSV